MIDRAWTTLLQYVSYSAGYWKFMTAQIIGATAVSDQRMPEQEPSSSCETWLERSSFSSQLRATPQRRRRETADGQQQLIENIVANRIIPRLLLANSTDVIAPAAEVATAPSQARSAELTTVATTGNVGDFSELVIAQDARACLAYFEERRAQGASIEALFQDLLAPTARRLGVLWDEDINDFVDVTRGFTHLQQIVQDYSDAFRKEGRAPASHRRALVMPMPGEQHTFGASLIAEQFRREGWRVWGGPPQHIDDILELVDAQHFDVVGLSVSRLDDTQTVAGAIRMVRAASLNKDIAILIGGKAFLDRPDLVTTVGADATARDAHDAVITAGKLLGTTRRIGT
jgi:MerR family transcriptional regulator, light-induced transcriptional regulator